MPVSGKDFELCTFRSEIEENWRLSKDGSGWIDKELTGLKEIVEIGGQDRFDEGEGTEGRRISPYRDRVHGIAEDAYCSLGVMPYSLRMHVRS
jgi:hypothetical protein